MLLCDWVGTWVVTFGVSVTARTGNTDVTDTTLNHHCLLLVILKQLSVAGSPCHRHPVAAWGGFLL